MDQELDHLLRGAAADRHVIGLAGGLPSESQFPRRALAQSFLRVLRYSGSPALQYGWAEGSDGLRAFVAERLRLRGARASAEDVIVTSGAQQAIAMALELTTSRDDGVAVDAETYPAVLELLRCRGLRAVTAVAGAACAYVMPVVSNPRGRGLTETERTALLEGTLPLIEDDAYGELRFSGPPPIPLLASAPDRVFHVGTLSKVLCPGLRVGWLVVPEAYRERARALKQGTDLQASSLSQAIVQDYLLGDGSHPGVDFDARLARLRRFYQRRAEVMARALRRHLPAWSFSMPEGGFAIWVETPAAIPEQEFLSAAIEEGVAFDPGSLFRPPGTNRPELSLRLCFSAAKLASFDIAVERLARTWARFAHVQGRPSPPLHALQQE